MENCLQWDWVSITVKMPIREYEKYKCKGYRIERAKHHTNIFRQVHYIYAANGDEIGYVASYPHPHIMDEDRGLLKLNNKYLYQSNLLEFVKSTLNNLGMQFIAYSRLDCAMDFCKFANNRLPEKFVKKYICDEYMKIGRSKGYLNFVEGDVKGKKFQALTFGGKDAEVKYQLYNKSQEMKDVKYKPWIYENWCNNGYDGSEGINETKSTDVWRLEFRLKKTKKGVYILDKQTGESELVLDMTDINSLANLKYAYGVLLDRYFSFVHNEKRIRKDRCKPLKLFKNDFKVAGVRLQLSDKKESDRASRQYAKHLVKLEYELRGLSIPLSVVCSEMVSYYLLSRGLKKWAEQKLNYDISNTNELLYSQQAYSTMLQPNDYDLTKPKESAMSLDYIRHLNLLKFYSIKEPLRSIQKKYNNLPLLDGTKKKIQTQKGTG